MNLFCHKCGKKLAEDERYCSGCGTNVFQESSVNTDSPDRLNTDGRWWLRLAKVFYIVLYLPLLLVIPLVWSSNAPYYSSYSHQYYGSYTEAFWYSLLTLTIYVLIIRLIKIAFLYIAMGEKPKWQNEFTKFF